MTTNSPTKTRHASVMKGFTLVEILVVVAIIVLLIALLLPAIESRTAPCRPQCMNNLKQIGLALHTYHDVYGSFPPAYIADEDGKPMHSWRVLILPYMEYQALYEKYDFDEPWDGPNNSLLHDTMVAAYSCPSDPDSHTTMTNYVVIVGSNTVFPEDQSIALDDVTDDPDATIAVVETVGSDIHWMEPRDLATESMPLAINPGEDMPRGISSAHSGGAQALLADGSVRFLSDSVKAKTLRAMLTVADGETIDLND